MTNRRIPCPDCGRNLCGGRNVECLEIQRDALRAEVAKLNACLEACGVVLGDYKAKLARYEGPLTKEQIRAVSMELTTIESVAEHDAAIRKVRGEP